MTTKLLSRHGEGAFAAVAGAIVPATAATGLSQGPLAAPAACGPAVQAR